MADISISCHDNYCVGHFSAMASLCEILVEGQDKQLTEELTQLAYSEVKRIEQKFSRYRKDNICFQINNSQGKSVHLDEETRHLLAFAEQCYQLSDGLFDLTSGVLRRIWHFDGSANIPTKQQIEQTLKKVGWHNIALHAETMTMPKGMEIDFGGIGKEYAVDKVSELLKQQTDKSVLVNLGGDMRVTKPMTNNTPWRVGVDDPSQNEHPIYVVQIHQGAIATSGDANRFLLKDGIRYSHILNPKTGQAITEAPRSVTVAASTCIEAGLLSTLALLQGADAKDFLQAQEVDFWLK